MYEPRQSSLPIGYSLKVATQDDSIKIFYFELVGYYSSIEKFALILLILVLFVFLRYALFAASVSAITFFFITIVPISIILILLFYGESQRKKGLADGSISALIVEFRNNICGCIYWLNHENYTFVHGLLISNSDRKNGIGGFLIATCKDRCRKPIYLVCNSQLEPFYIRCGFINADYSDVPNEIARRRRKNEYLHVMAFRSTD